MLPTQTNLAIQTDILPTQNIGVLDQNPPPIYSLLSNSNSPNSAKQNRRKKTMKLDETMPVMINPQITRMASGVTFIPPHLHRSTIPLETIPSFVSSGLINGPLRPYRVCFEPNTYDANNNINHNQMPSISMSLNPSLPTQIQKTSTTPWSNESSLSAVNTNSMSHIMTKSQFFGVNRFLNNNINERTISIPSPQHNGYHLNPSFTSTEQGSIFSHSHPIPSSLSSISTTSIPAVKPKRSKNKLLKSWHIYYPLQSILKGHNRRLLSNYNNCNNEPLQFLLLKHSP